MIVLVMSERALLCTGAGEGVLLIDAEYWHVLRRSKLLPPFATPSYSQAQAGAEP